LADEQFWDNYHKDKNRDWFLNHTLMGEYLAEHTVLGGERSGRLCILDLGCGTSTLSTMLMYKYKGNIYIYYTV